MKKVMNVLLWIVVALVALVVVGQTMRLMEQNKPAVNNAVNSASRAVDKAAEVVNDSYEAVADQVKK